MPAPAPPLPSSAGTNAPKKELVEAQEYNGASNGSEPEVGRQTTAMVLKDFNVRGSVADFHPGTVRSQTVSSTFSVPMSWHKLHYKAAKYQILRGLTGTALPGRCLAIMGSSGAGKTTFLNAICDRLATGGILKFSGRRQLGDIEYERPYRKAMGFVTQDDIISSLSTPYDALWFSLRTRRGTDMKETRERVVEALEMLRLVHCQDTKVGVPGLEAGLSGGERKRCNIGIELICDPKILLLDEPTSGLDSVTSAKVIHLLRHLSRVGRTIIYTIHQPTAEVLTYFDDLMLLTQGRVVYHGTMNDSIGYFAEIGFPCPDTYTPSDHYMVLLQDNITSKVLIKRWRKYIKNRPRTAHTTAIRLAKSKSESETTKFLDAYIKKFGSSPYVQFIEITRRMAVEISRNNLYIFSYVIQALFFSILVGLIFINLQSNQSGIQDREGLLYTVIMQHAFGPTFMMMNSFHNVRAVYVREQQAGAYSPLMYYVGCSVAELPVQTIACFVESIILYFMTGLHASAQSFFTYFAVIFMVTQVAVGLGFALSASCESLVVASGLAPLILIPLSLAGGLFASTARLRPYWYWLEKPSFLRQGFILLMRNEFQHLHDIRCNNYDNGDFYCVVAPHNGDLVLEQLGFNNDPQSIDAYLWLSLALLFLIVRIISVIALAIAGRRKY